MSSTDQPPLNSSKAAGAAAGGSNSSTVGASRSLAARDNRHASAAAAGIHAAGMASSMHAASNAAAYLQNQNNSSQYAASDISSVSQRHYRRGSERDREQREHEQREASPLASPASFSYAASTAHKRTASSNPRSSRASAVGGGDGQAASVEEQQQQQQQRAHPAAPRRTATERTERTTERTVITTRDVLVSRSRASPERRTHSRTGTQEAAATTTKTAATTAAAAAAETPAPPWKPEASLVAHTTAPLASRISIPPRASLVPASLQPAPLGELSLERQEAVLMEDLLCVFMGCEGQYVRFGKGYDPAEERDRLAGPVWRMEPGLDPSLADLAGTMLQTATHYAALEAFVDVQSREMYGLVCQALCAAVRRLLQDYLVLVAQLETQFLRDEGFTLHVLHLHLLPTSQMMRQLYALAQELLKQNGLLDDDEDGGGSSSGEDDDDDDDYDKIVERLREGGELLPGHGAGAARRRLCKGGAVLGLITRRLEALGGDPGARALLTGLLEAASRPYMAMLNEWLHHGAIRDPHVEFLVKEHTSIRREVLQDDYTDEYWDRRYTVREEAGAVPPQLAGNVTSKVLLAGKYLNVVRECGGVDTSEAPVADAPETFGDARFLDNIHAAYAHANAALLRLLLTTHALPARLRSLKHYFFLDPSDYFAHFLELGHNELRKRSLRAVNTSKLQSLLDLVLRQPGSVVSLDPFKEDVKVEMNGTTLVQALQRVVNITGVDQGDAMSVMTGGAAEASNAGQSSSSTDADGYASLQLDYAVPFPVSLVVGRKTIWRYQALFRFLLSLHHLEAQLAATWQTQVRELGWCHRSSSGSVGVWKRRLFTLRARMLVFVQQLLYFCTAEVIEPNWQALMTRLEPGKKGGDGDGDPLPDRTVDELMQDHVDFLDTCLKECMLTNSKLLKIHAKLMQTCFSFVNFVSYLTRNMDKIDSDLAGTTAPRDATAAQWKAFQAAKPPPPSDPSADDMRSLVDKLAKYEHSFGRNLQVLLDALNHYAATETVVLLSLCARLSTANQGTEYAGLRQEEE